MGCGSENNAAGLDAGEAVKIERAPGFELEVTRFDRRIKRLTEHRIQSFVSLTTCHDNDEGIGRQR